MVEEKTEKIKMSMEKIALLRIKGYGYRKIARELGYNLAGVKSAVGRLEGHKRAYKKKIKIPMIVEQTGDSTGEVSVGLPGGVPAATGESKPRSIEDLIRAGEQRDWKREREGFREICRNMFYQAIQEKDEKRAGFWVDKLDKLLDERVFQYIDKRKQVIINYNQLPLIEKKKFETECYGKLVRIIMAERPDISLDEWRKIGNRAELLEGDYNPVMKLPAAQTVIDVKPIYEQKGIEVMAAPVVQEAVVEPEQVQIVGPAGEKAENNAAGAETTSQEPTPGPVEKKESEQDGQQ